jgi:hypothetical protein
MPLSDVLNALRWNENISTYRPWNFRHICVSSLRTENLLLVTAPNTQR